MKVKVFRHLWGITEPYELVLPKIKDAGYDGIEFAILKTLHNPFISSFIQDNKMEFIAQVHTTGNTVKEHLESFKELVNQSISLNAVLINSQSGKDSWSFAEKREFTARALEFQTNLPVSVAHETHRGRITYNPWETDALLKEFSELKLCCDFSHWVCVCERLIDSEMEILQRCADRCIHLHARIGYEQGPQVPDPRAPEYYRHLEAHEKWWEMIWRSQLNRRVPVTTLTPEFGPPAYHHTLPYTNTPVSNLWEICDWVKDRQLERINHILNTVSSDN